MKEKNRTCPSKQGSRTGIYLLAVMGMFLILTNSCTKDETTPVPTTPQIPVLSTAAVTDITGTTASCGGNITSDHGFTVTSRGVCWSTGMTPTIADPKTTDGTGAGNFTSAITGLIANTTYYVRAYATNSAGTGYGSAMSFKTIKAPIVTTSAVSAITQTTASCGGNIKSDGGTNVTLRGVCWSKSTTPTIADPKTTDGSDTGSFTSAITGLSPQTTYYVRAYATNSSGTGYGSAVSFKTADSSFVPTTETNKVALLEYFTGVRCGYCPDGFNVAKGIEDAYPDKFITMAIHAGPYAAAQAGWPNYTTTYGDALISQAKVSGYPAGTMNRITGSTLGVTPQITGGYAIGRNYWATAAAYVMAQIAPVNIAADATFNTVTKQLTVKVNLYYTRAVTGSNNINVALLQDKINGKQSGGTPDPNNYEQNHVVRHFITGQWGDVISATGQILGSRVSKTYTYTVPSDYNGTGTDGGGAVVIDNLSVVVFITNGQTDVLNALSVDVK
jgi:hypothetical protein